MTRSVPPGAGAILWTASGFIIATLSFTSGMILRSAIWGMVIYFALWIAALMFVALKQGRRHG